MKNSKLAKIVAGIVLPVASIFGGCSNSAGVDFDFLSVKATNKSAAYGQNDTREGTDNPLFRGQPEAYKNQPVPVPEGFWEGYKDKN